MPESTRSAVSHLRPKRKTRARLSKVAGARDTIRGFGHDMDVVGLTFGQFSMLDLIDATLEITGPADVVVSERIDGPDLEAYCGQVSRLRDAQAWIAEEGLIVADAKGVPMPHPALLIERQAQDEIRKWGSAFRPARGRR